MPIRINLLAEAQAAEEQRRKDPVKRVMWIGGALVVLLLAWCAVLEVRVLASKSRVNTLTKRWQDLEKTNFQVVDNRKKTIEIEQKLTQLERMTTNRFLWGTALNALRLTMNGVEEVQLVRIKTEQGYVVTEEPPLPKGRTNAVSKAAAKPPTSTEKIAIHLEAMDSSGQPGSQVNNYKEAITQVPFFAESLQKTNGVLLTTLSPPQMGVTSRNPFVLFTLQCSFPEKVRF